MTPKDTDAGNFVPELDFLGYYHATCKCLWNAIMFATGRCELVIMIFLSVRFADEGQLGYEN